MSSPKAKQSSRSTNNKQEAFIQSALQKQRDKEELIPYQAELIKLQNHLELTGRKLIILFDGRDASGKGGTIRRVSRYMNEKRYRVIALGKPTNAQITELHMKRYIEKFPHAGEIVLFDRSWYNRAMVEPVMGFCSSKQYRQFMFEATAYEKAFISDGQTTLLKLYFSVSKQEQAKRFERRMNDPLRAWKLSEVDMQAQDLWNEFTEKKYRLLQKTHIPESKWYVIRSDDKHQARLNTMRLILKNCRYYGRARSLDFDPDPKIIIEGDKELRLMQQRYRVHGEFVS